MDYLDLGSKKGVQNLLRNQERLEIFSDFVFRINSKMEKSRKIILLNRKFKYSNFKTLDQIIYLVSDKLLSSGALKESRKVALDHVDAVIVPKQSKTIVLVKIRDS